MPQTLFLVWKAGANGEHIPVGRLTYERQQFRFQYVEGAKRAIEKGMGTIPQFPELNETYRSAELFSFFRSRLMDSHRPDFGSYIDSLGLNQHDSPLLPFEVLDRSGGRKTTDRFRIFRKPEKIQGRFQIHCFVTGMTRSPILQHLDEILGTLTAGDRLFPALEVQNTFDPHAIALRKENGWNVGYVPGYYALELQPLLRENPESVLFHATHVNHPAHKWLPDALLVSIAGKWPAMWKPFEDRVYASLAGKAASRVQ